MRNRDSSIKEGKMEVYQELTIFNVEGTIAELIDRMEKKLSAGWVRSKSSEERLREMQAFQYCFDLEEHPEYSPTHLWLYEEEGNSLRISNIVSDKKRQLSYAEYNQLVQHFNEHVIRPTVGEVSFEVEITKSDVTIDDIVSELVAKKLKIFSAVANKSTGAAHPLDRRRWMDFLVEAHRSETDLSPSMLRRWMCEVEGWSEDIASELTCDYETSRELLNYYDTH